MQNMGNRNDLSEEPPDDKWMAEEVERRRMIGEQERTRQILDRLAERERLPLSKRLHRVEVGIQLSTTVSAGNIAGDESGGKSKPSSKIPPAADELALAGEDRREVDRLEKLIKDGVGKLEQILDQHNGLAGPRTEMGTEELDSLLVTYEGRTPEDVSLLEPSLGSPEAVRRSRAKMKRKRETGVLI